MTKILVFTTTASRIGGVETWIDRFCDHLGRHGFQPIVGLAKGLKFNNPDSYLAHHPSLESVVVDGSGLNREGRILSLMRCIKRVKPHVTLPMSLVEANDAAIGCKQAGQSVKHVIHAQGNLPNMLCDLKYYAPGIDHIVCPGKLTRNVLESWGKFPCDRITHIPNGADLAIADRRDRKPNSPLRIGYVGRFTQQDKRVLDLIDFHAKLTEKGVDFELLIVGDGAEKVSLTNALAKHKNVTIRPPTSSQELYTEVYPNLDMLILCSSSEAFGIVIIEAMMNGVVPVTSAFLGSGAEKLVTPNETGFLFPIGDLEAAASHVALMSQNPGELSRLSGNCATFARSNYAWDRSLSKWADVLRRVVEQPALGLPIFSDRVKGPAGTLEKFGVPVVVRDALRRARIRFLGSSVPAGGEEWPLYNRHHTEQELEQVTNACIQCDREV